MNSNIVSLKFNSKSIEKMKTFYKEDLIENSNPYIVAAYKNENCNIFIYTTNVVVFQGKNASYESSIWQEDYFNSFTFNCDHAGSDETGTGDFFGPIIVVATYVTKKDFPLLFELGVGDSKNISDEKIKIIAPVLIKNIPYSQLALDNAKYNDLVLNKKFNQNKIKSYLHNQALLTLQKKLKNNISFFVIDQFTPKDKYFNYLKGVDIVEQNIEFTTKGEEASLAVAAASIIARYSFVKRMEKLGNKLKITLPKGASDLVDETARKILNKYNSLEVFNSIAKLNFKNYETLKKSKLL